MTKRTLLLILARIFIIISVCVLPSCSNSSFDEGKSIPAVLMSGEPIPVGTHEGIGPMAGAAIWHTPLGYAHVFGSEQPDLFAKDDDKWYPGVYLYPWRKTSYSGIPVFGERIKVETPFGINPGTVFQGEKGGIHGLWIVDMDLVHTLYEVENSRFVEKDRVTLQGLPGNPHALAVLNNPDGSIEVILGMHDVTGFHPPGGRDKSWRPYDDKGAYAGAFNNCYLYAVTLELFSGPVNEPRMVSETKHEVWDSYRTLASVNLGNGRERDIVSGSRFGNFRYYNNMSGIGSDFTSGYVVGPDGTILRHPVIGACPTAYPNPETGLSDLIAAGEGGFYYYKFTGEFNHYGDPVYDEPVPVLKKNSHLYGGSLPVPNVVDWTGNGVMDIITGYSDGRVLFHENSGTNAQPAFQPGVPVIAGGTEIHVQPGYSQSLQGPGESRFGYVCPTVVDWNGNGLPDIVMSDATSQHRVFINRGTPGNPQLDYGQSLFVKGLELFGTWRVKPAVAMMGDKMAYVILDEDDELRLYWRIDDYNLEDGGKIKLVDGINIRGNFLDAGGSGRAKLNLVDWNGNGKVDLIIGTPRHGSFPNPENGLPQSLGLPGAAVLLMENIGTNETPVFGYPMIMSFRGEKVFFGQHACGPAIADFRNPAGYDLIVAKENGIYYYFNREDLSFSYVRKLY